MIQKIKEMMAVKDMVQSLQKDMIELSSSFGGLREECSQLTKDIGVLSTHMNQVREDVATTRQSAEEELGAVSNLQEKFSKAITEFQVQKTQLEKRMLEKAGAHVKPELDRFSSEIDRYGQLQKELDSVVAEMARVRGELTKFRRISGELKERDFSAATFAKEVFSADQEKLALMRRLDKMEKLVAAQRRKNPRSR
jgi:chromosome segregation ATPase